MTRGPCLQVMRLSCDGGCSVRGEVLLRHWQVRGAGKGLPHAHKPPSERDPPCNPLAYGGALACRTGTGWGVGAPSALPGPQVPFLLRPQPPLHSSNKANFGLGAPGPRRKRGRHRQPREQPGQAKGVCNLAGLPCSPLRRLSPHHPRPKDRTHCLTPMAVGQSLFFHTSRPVELGIYPKYVLLTP